MAFLTKRPKKRTGERIEKSDYPTPECLTPDEVEELVFMRPGSEPEWAKPRLAHLETCDACKMLMAATEPSLKHQQQFNRLLDERLNRTADERPAVAINSKWKRILAPFQSRFAAPFPRFFAPVSTVSVLVLASLITYSSLSPDSREYVNITISHPGQTWHAFMQRREEDRQNALEQLKASLNLDQLAGKLPDDPKVKESVELLTRASVNGNLAQPEKIAAAKRKIEEKAQTADPSTKQAWRNHELKLDGADTLVRYKALSGQKSLENLQVVDVSVENHIPRVIVGSEATLDPRTKDLLEQSFAQTEGIGTRLDVYKGTILVYELQRPNPRPRF